MANKKLELVGLKVKDLRNVELINVDFRGKRFIEISGTNGSAKTTLIDSIFLALQGPKYLGRGYPAWRVINKDADKALLKVVLGNSERTIEVKRSITKRGNDTDGYEAGGSLTITDTDGNKLDQAFLDSLISDFTVDPVSFSRKSPSEQIDIIKALGGIDTGALDKEREEAYQERMIANRTVKGLEPQIKIEPPKIEAVDVTKLNSDLKELIERNAKIREANAEIDKKADLLKMREETIQQKISEIKRLQEEVETLQKTRDETAIELKKMGEKQPEASLDPLQAAIESAQETNIKARKRQEWETNMTAYKAAKSIADKYDKIVKDYPEKKRKLFQASSLPFKNVDFDEEVGLLIDGIPFNQKSDAEKIRISTRVGMELRPDFKVICIKDGSLLDETSLETIKQLALKNDYQVLVEKVDDDEKEGENVIVMRSGKVISEFLKTVKKDEDSL